MSNTIQLDIQASCTTARFGFPLKLVTRWGATYGLATDEAHAQRQIRALQVQLENHPRYDRGR
jgi:hypothetical protein